MRTHGVRHTYTDGGCRCGPCTKANADYMREWYRRRRQRGWGLLELMCVCAISAILLLEAVPSLVHANNQAALQSAVNTFKWTYLQTPVLPPDPTWSVNGNTWTKTLTQPAGVLTITTPTTTGGSFTCQFSDASYHVRC